MNSQRQGIGSAASGSTRFHNNDGNKSPGVQQLKNDPITRNLYGNQDKKVQQLSSATQKTRAEKTGLVLTEKTSKPRAKKEKEAEVESSSWPPFTFDGSNALKSKLVLNLRNCQYNLFRDIAVDEMGWRVIDSQGRTLEKLPK